MSDDAETLARAEKELGALGALPPAEVTCVRFQKGRIITTHKLPLLFEVVPEAAFGFMTEEEAGPDVRMGQPLLDARSFVYWINIVHPDQAVYESLTDFYGVHPLVLEDIQEPLSRSKMEDWRTSIYVSLQLPSLSGGSPHRIEVPLILGPGYVLSFIPTDSAVYRAVMARLETNKGRLQESGADALFIAILDEAIDRSFPVVELMESEIEDMEELILTGVKTPLLEEILSLKRSASSLRHYLWPLGDIFMSLYRLPSPLLRDTIRVHIRDLVDHCRHLIDLAGNLRDMAGGLLDLYHTASAVTMNKVMKVLTLISTIFIPLTFVAGLYGMNFEYMPELSQPWAYPVVLGIMGGISAGMVGFFKWKRWI